MNEAANLIGEGGINFNVGFETSDIIYISAAIFAALLLAGGLLVLMNHALRKQL